MGVIALFIDWSKGVFVGGNANGIDWIKKSELFYEGPRWILPGNGFEWWLTILSILAFIGVGFLVLTFVGKVIPGSPLPQSPGIGKLGALLLTLCPLMTHVGFWVWLGVEFDADAGDTWDGMWANDGPGIWLALVGGIVAIMGTSAIAKRADQSS